MSLGKMDRIIAVSIINEFKDYIANLDRIYSGSDSDRGCRNNIGTYFRTEEALEAFVNDPAAILKKRKGLVDKIRLLESKLRVKRPCMIPPSPEELAEKTLQEFLALKSKRGNEQKPKTNSKPKSKRRSSKPRPKTVTVPLPGPTVKVSMTEGESASVALAGAWKKAAIIAYVERHPEKEKEEELLPAERCEINGMCLSAHYELKRQVLALGGNVSDLSEIDFFDGKPLRDIFSKAVADGFERIAPDFYFENGVEKFRGTMRKQSDSQATPLTRPPEKDSPGVSPEYAA